MGRGCSIAREAEELPLAGGEVGAALLDLEAEHVGRQPRAADGLRLLLGRRRAERVEVVRRRCPRRGRVPAG